MFTVYLPKRIKELREKKGLTQEKLADLCGVARNTIIRYENGKMIPTTKILDKLSFYLNTSIDYLFGISNNSKVEYSNIGALTGLSDNAIDTLKKLNNEFGSINRRVLEIINTLLDINNFDENLEYFDNLYTYIYDKAIDVILDLNGDTRVISGEILKKSLLLKNNLYLENLKNNVSKRSILKNSK